MASCYSYLLAADSLTFSGCFTLAPGLTIPAEIAKLGWTSKWDFSDLSIQLCVNHCLQNSKAYAGVETVSLIEAKSKVFIVYPACLTVEAILLY